MLFAGIGLANQANALSVINAYKANGPNAEARKSIVNVRASGSLKTAPPSGRRNSETTQILGAKFATSNIGIDALSAQHWADISVGERRVEIAAGRQDRQVSNSKLAICSCRGLFEWMLSAAMFWREDNVAPAKPNSGKIMLVNR